MASDPDIFSYTDYRAFLRDWLQVRKRSYETLKRRSGVSKSHLSNIVSGARRLTPAAAETLAEGLWLDIHETRFFLALVALREGDTERQRAEADRVVQGMARFRNATRIQQDALALASAWYIPVVLELAQLPGFVASATWMADRTRPRITEAQAQEALDVLTRLEVLVLAEDGSVTVRPDQFATHHQVVDELAGAAVRSTMRQWLRLADAALHLPHNERQFGSITVAVPRDRLDEFRSEVQRFQQRVLGLESTVRTDGDVIYHLGVQFFPVTEPDQSTET